MFGSPETTPGGRALKFYSSVRLDIRRVESIKDGAEMIGNRTRVKVAKNKVAPPFKMAEFDIMYGKGISREGSVLDVGVDLDIVKKSGAWFTYEGEQLGQGRENAKQFLSDNLDMMLEIMEKIRVSAGIGEDDIDLTDAIDDPVDDAGDDALTDEPAPVPVADVVVPPAKPNGKSSAKSKADIGAEL
jgi:recombination protein RecA